MKSFAMLFFACFVVSLSALSAAEGSKGRARSLLPSGWDPALAGDTVMRRLVNTSGPQVKGAHDAEFVCVGDRACLVAEANNLKAGESAGWPFIYATMSIVNLKSLKTERIIDFAKSGQKFGNETLPAGACFVPRIIHKDAGTLRCYFTSEDPGRRQSQMWYRDFDLKRGEFAQTIRKAKLKTAAGTFDFQPQYFHADAAAQGFKKKPSDSSFFIFDSFKSFDGRTYVALNNFSGKQNALAVLHEDFETFEVIGHYNEPQSQQLSESAVNRLPDGTWMAICRNDGGNYHFTTSKDGRTWSAGKELSIVPNGSNSKPTFDTFSGIHYLGWQESTRLQGVSRSVFNVDISRDGRTWERKYRFETPKSFQYPTFHEHKGTIWLCVTQGDTDPSRKERIMFGKLETVGEFESQRGQKRIEWPTSGDALPADLPKTSTRSPGLRQDFNLILGTQAIGGKYQFTSKPALVEGSEAAHALGASCMKFELRLPADRRMHSLAELVAKDATCRQVLDMPFRDFLLWVNAQAEGAWARGLKPDELNAEYHHMHDLAVQLLKSYSGTGKTFYLGHWEGDNMLRGDIGAAGDAKMADTVRVQGFIDWLRVRQKAVEDAKRDTPHENVEVWHYTEVNHPTISVLEDRPSIANCVLPHVPVDFVSYSAYDSQHDPKLLRDTLNYLQSKLAPKTGLPKMRVFIGEYGFPTWKDGKPQDTPDQQNDHSLQVILTALEWGCPFILYWELYNNETDPDGTHRGYWMIDHKGAKQPIYETHQTYYTWARQWVLSETAKTGHAPAESEFRLAALKFLKSLSQRRSQSK